MIATVLDRALQSAFENRSALPVYKHLYDAIMETKPKAFVDFDWSNVATNGRCLPDKDMDWAEPAFCLTAPHGISHYGHTIAALRAPHANKFTGWLENVTWQLQGVMVFKRNPASFDVIGMLGTHTMPVMFPEAQISFNHEPGMPWSWDYAVTGPVNRIFYDFYVDAYEEADAPVFRHAIDQLGGLYSQFLGYWMHKLEQPGKWTVNKPKPPRLQMKHGKIKKVLREPLLGYSTYTLTRT